MPMRSVMMAMIAIRCASVVSFVSLGSTRLAKCTHQYPPAPGIVDIHQPIGPIRTRRPVHDRLRDAIGLQPKFAQPRNPPAGQVKNGVAVTAHAMEVVTLHGH